MRVIDCNECGETLSAANDAELTSRLLAHMKQEHPDTEIDPDGATEAVEDQAYSASDS